MTGIRLLATDLDGTLLRPDGSVSAETRDALARARGAGFPVVFVTGRPPRWMDAVAAVTGHAEVAVCGNGAVLLDVAQRHVLQRHEIHADVGVEVVRRLRRMTGTSTLFAVERVAPGPLPHAPAARTPARPGQGEQLAASGDVIKILARVDAPLSLADDFLAHARAELADLVEVTHSSGAVLLECGPFGVTKAGALAGVAADRGVPREHVAAVGDMPNDLDMLAWAGHSFAVATGHAAAIATAAAVLPGPLDDGVAGLLERIVAEYVGALRDPDHRPT